MLESREKWVGPFQIRKLLEHCLDDSIPKPPHAPSAYVVTRTAWQSNPTAESVPLYVGGNTQNPNRFRMRVGALLADAFGFYNPKIPKGHAGGRSIHRWCFDNSENPLDLHIAWVEGSACHRCLECRLCQALKPRLNRSNPAKCKTHPSPSASTER
jgi:hypothetical protein